MTQPRLSHLDTWARMEKGIHKILEHALFILTQKDELPEQENDITRELRFCLIPAYRRLVKSDKSWECLSFPWIEAPNQPSPDDAEKVSREDKRPDVQFNYHDENEIDDFQSVKYYVIECKRLGKKSPSNWAFNENYIKRGIMRFIAEDHGYGKGGRSGVMIGYVQNMELEDILSEVNEAAVSQKLETLSNPSVMLLEGGWNEAATSLLQSEFERTFPQSPFLLHHFWVDLRNQYPTNNLFQNRGGNFDMELDE